MAEGDLIVRPGVVIPARELHFKAVRSSGPGGQNVNKVATKIELRWHPSSSVALDDITRPLVLVALATRLTKSGEIVLSAQGQRRQSANRKAVIERLRRLVDEALDPDAERKATRMSRAARRRRLDGKRRRSTVKQLRKPPRNDSEG